MYSGQVNGGQVNGGQVNGGRCNSYSCDEVGKWIEPLAASGLQIVVEEKEMARVKMHLPSVWNRS